MTIEPANRDQLRPTKIAARAPIVG